MQKVRFKKNGKNLSGDLILPHNPKGGIIITHSFRNDRTEPVCSQAAEHFATLGYAVLNFDLQGHGESEGRLRDLPYSGIAEDFRTAYNFLKEVMSQNRKMGAYAISLGTMAVAISKTTLDAKVLISPSPIIDPQGLYKRYLPQIEKKSEELQKRGFTKVKSGSGRGYFEIGQKWIEEMRTFNGRRIRGYWHNGSPTCIIQGTEDELTDIEKVEKIANKGKTNTVYLIEEQTTI